MKKGVNIIEKLKGRAASLKQNLSAIYYASKNSEVSIKTKALIVITIGYAMSPIDLIPDFIPVIGYLDDLIILPALISLTIRSIPNEIWNDAIDMANENPISLKKNWKFGIAFIIIWILILVKIILIFIK